MFIVLEFSDSHHFFNVPYADKFSEVCLVNVKLNNETPVETLYLLGDFVKKSLVLGSWVGLVGISNTEDRYYIGLDVKRTTLGIHLTNSDGKTISTKGARVVLHFKSR